MAKTGRPEKLTKQLQEEMVKHVRSGNYVETVCAYVGIYKDTFYNWMRRGAKEKERVMKNPKARIRKDEQKYVEFSDAIKEAEASAEMRDVTLIAKAAEDQWQASAWRLERKFPQRWGRKEQLEHSGKDGGPIETENTEKLDLSSLTDEELDEFEKIVNKASGNGDNGSEEEGSNGEG